MKAEIAREERRLADLKVEADAAAIRLAALQKQLAAELRRVNCRAATANPSSGRSSRDEPCEGCAIPVAFPRT